VFVKKSATSPPPKEKKNLFDNLKFIHTDKFLLCSAYQPIEHALVPI